MKANMTTRVALVTGCGKQDGMGRAIARTLAGSGWPAANVSYPEERIHP
jgi:NAD(P)-dependent dehydrogenase (short-subunit alcohol dehydrogenase family)